MLTGSLPRRYARALVGLAAETGEIREYGEALEKVVRALSGEPTIFEALAGRSFPVLERQKAVEEILARMRVPLLLKNFFLFLIQKERFGFLAEIGREYGRLQDEILGIVRVRVRSPQVPKKATLHSIERILKKRLNKAVIADGEADPEILGGVTMSIGHTVYDGSVKRELERIHEKMLQGSPS